MANNAPIKEQIINRSKILISLFFGLSLLIIAKIFYIQTKKKKELLALVKDIQEKERTIDATRGNIYASDGVSLLATSVPQYEVVLDPSQAKPKLFNKSVDSLALLLSFTFKDAPKEEYKTRILRARQNRSRYLLLSRKDIDHALRVKIETFPLFREGNLKGGGHFITKEKRFLPYHNLAMRTIGKMDKTHTKDGAFGIEASFNDFLRGKDGQGFYERLAGGYLKPVDSESDINAEPGYDIYTTLDINFQDIVESALREQVTYTQAKYGLAVIMEIKTGEIKAMANLSSHLDKNDNLVYYEDKNYAVAEGTDPGSTFKLASIAAVLEKSGIELNQFVVNCQGEINHRGLSFTCSHKHNQQTVQQVFENSCNIGIYTLMKNHFGFNKSQAYFDYLKKFRLNLPTGFQLKGEALPLINTPKSESFSATTVPWMSIGYETRLTPLQMLTFYNAIANGGYWIQPLLIKEIKQGAEVKKRYEASKVNEPIISAPTYEKIRKMMEGVVKNGTAKSVNYGYCKIAGKTGTSQKRTHSGYKAGQYYTSFIGYFPANNPRYSCVVVIDEPQGSRLFGGDVSAPVFRKIAEKIYAYDIQMHPPAKTGGTNNGQLVHKTAKARGLDLKTISEAFEWDTNSEFNGIGKIKKKGDEIVYTEDKDTNVIGLPLKNALAILENQGYRVSYSGIGRVSKVEKIKPNHLKLTLK